MDELIPIYRIEFFLDAIVNNTTPPDPIYRAEFYLAKIAGADVEIPEPVYRMEKYLAYLCGEEVELPDPIYRIEYYLAFLCGLNVAIPDPIYRVEFWLWDWCGGGGIEKTVTGNPIHILDALAKPAQALSIALEPIQDLHGYDNPWPAGGGKNKCPTAGLTLGVPSDTSFGNTAKRTFTLGTYINGLTNNNYYSVRATDVTVAENSIKFTTSASAYGLSIPLVGLTVGQVYTISAVMTNALIGLSFYAEDGTYISGKMSTASNNYCSATVPSDTFFTLACFGGVTNDTESTFTDIQLEAGSTATSFAPYSNICPISGHTDADVTRTGKNLLDPSKRTSYTQGNGQRWYESEGYMLRANQAYTFSVTSAKRIALYIRDKATGDNFVTGNIAVTYTPTADTVVYFQAYRAEGISSVDTFQLELGSTATDYEEYRGTTYPIPLGQTVYGGTLDVVTGVLTVDRAAYTFDGNEQFYIVDNTRVEVFSYFRWYGTAFTSVITNWNLSNTAIMSCYQVTNQVPYWYSGGIGKPHSAWTVNNAAGLCIRNDDYATEAELKASLVGQTMVYELATPQTIQLTPQQVELLLGENNIWSDGEMTLVYLADGNASDAEALNILLGGRYVNNHGEDEPTDREALDILLGRTR